MNKGFWGIVLGMVALILIVLLVRPLLPEASYPEKEYNRFTFTQVEGTWYFDWQKNDKVYVVGLRNHPEDVEDVVVKGFLNQSFNERREIYVTFDPVIGDNSKNFTILALGATELTNNMAKVLGYKPLSACSREAPECEGTPIVTCDTKNASVIYLKDVGEAGIVLDGDCITLRGDNMELLRSIDRILYQWYGVMGKRWAQ